MEGMFELLVKEMMSFSHSYQVFPQNLLKANYLDPRTNELKARSEIQRRGKYIEMLHGKLVDPKHALVVLIKGCLEYEPVKRPTARQALERLGEMRAAVHDPYTDLNRLQLERSLTDKVALIQQLATKIAASGDRMSRLETLLQQTEVGDSDQMTQAPCIV